MPPVDPSRLPQGWNQPAAPAVTPQPFPGAVPNLPVMVNPQQQFQNQATTQRLGIDAEQNNRGNIQTGISQQNNQRDQVTFNNKQTDREANDGVDTQQNQDQAAGHVVTLQVNQDIIRESMKKDPDSAKPKLLEFLAGKFGDDARTWSQDEVRQAVANSQLDILDSALYLATGAAYTERQEMIKSQALVPGFFDKPASLRAKKLRLDALIAQAKVRAGPANVKVLKALEAIDTNTLYAGYDGDDAEGDSAAGPPVPMPGTGGGEPPAGGTPPNVTLRNLDTGGGAKAALTADGKKVIVPNPPEMQEEFELFLKLPDNAPGKLSVDEYRTFLSKLYQKYGFSDITTSKADEDYVNTYNRGGKVGTTIPTSERDASVVQNIMSELGASNEGWQGDLATAGKTYTNAMTLGLPEALAGQEARAMSDIADEKHWKSALAGEVVGSVAPLMAGTSAAVKGIEKWNKIRGFDKVNATARQKLVAEAAANSGYGGIRGFNEADDGEGLSGAAEGIGMGAVATGTGQLLTKGTTSLLSDPTIAALNQMKNVKKTTLQRLGLGRVEEAAQGIYPVHGARATSVISFNKDNANRALAWIGQKVPKDVQPGVDTNNYIGKKFTEAYNNIRPQIVGAPDQTYKNQFTALKKSSSATPDGKAKFAEIEAAVAKFFDPKTGTYTGEGYREASTELRGLIKAYGTAYENAGDTVAGKMQRVAEQARKNMQHLVQRNTPEVGAELKKIERGYTHLIGIEDATNRATLADDRVYGPGQYAQSRKMLDTSPRRSATARGNAFDQKYALAGEKIVGSSGVPKFSVGQMATVGGILGYSSAQVPVLGAVLGSIIAGAYMPGLKQGVQLLLSGQRPDNKTMDAIRFAIEGYMQSTSGE